MGFLDQNERVVDIVLTPEGKKMLSLGNLEVSFCSFFDDGIVYDPWIENSGSLTQDELSSRVQQQIEASFVMEALPGRLSRELLNTVSLNSNLYTVPQSQRSAVDVLCSPDTTGSAVQVKQRALKDLYVERDSSGKVIESVGPIDRGFERLDSSRFQAVLSLDQQTLTNGEGFLVEFFSSGSDGLSVKDYKIDGSGRISFGQDIILTLK